MSEQAFNVIAGGDIQLIEGRQNAVKLAKELSSDCSTQVTVEREDGMELMQFADGSLYSLVCETRGRRKPTIAEQRRNRDDDDDDDDDVDVDDDDDDDAPARAAAADDDDDDDDDEPIEAARVIATPPAPKPA